jgi:hypothetical protein
MALGENGLDPTRRLRRFRYDATGLAGRHMRAVVDFPEDDARRDSDLPPGTRDVIAVDDTPSVSLEMRVHPVDMPERIAVVRFGQLALYEE